MVGSVGFDFPWSAHGANTIRKFDDENDFDEDNRIDTGAAVVFTVQFLNQIVNEA